MMPRRVWARAAAWAVAVALLSAGLPAGTQPPNSRPGREYRTITAGRYEISVQKSGRTDVNLGSRDPVFWGVCPMVWLEGEERPAPMTVSASWTGREPFNNRLGEGQSFLFQRKECEWVIQGYPAAPYLTVQAAFVNTSKQPVRVKALVPWGLVEGKGGLSLGAGAAEVVALDNGGLASLQTRLTKPSQAPVSSQWHVALWNPANRRSLTAGFLTNLRSFTQFRLERTQKAPQDTFDVFRAECIYEPPVEVAPGGRLESEVLFLSVADISPFDGLEAFGRAAGAVNGARPSRNPLPHGWDSWNTAHHTDITEEKLLAELDFLDKNLKRYGWTHLALDDGWQRARGDWEPDPARFPRGLKWLVDQVHARGMTAGIWTDPFTVHMATPLAREHPDWLVEATGPGKEMVGADCRILDVTNPGAYDHVKRLYAKIRGEWGFDALVEADYVYKLLFGSSYAQANLTRVEVLRLGMQAIREGFGREPGTFLTSMPPMAVTGVYVDGMRIGNDCAPLWRKQPERWPWGCVEALTNAAQRYFLASNLWAPDPDCAYFGHEDTRRRWKLENAPVLDWNQSLTWLTGAALTGGVVKIGDAFTSLSPREVDALSRLLPTVPQPARPVDLFERAEPCIWSLPIRTAIGQWHVVAAFNWDPAAPATLPVSFAALGLEPGVRYTVYDFWQDQYFGTARDRLDVAVGPGGVHLLGLRRYENRPMFLATDRHFTQGATDFTALDWDEGARRLRGVFEGVADTPYNLRVLVPPPYEAATVAVSAGPAETAMDKTVLKIGFRCAAAGPVVWTVDFRVP